MLILDFQKIVDLIIHSTKNNFLTEELIISSVERTKTRVIISLEDITEKITYKVTIFFDLYELNKAKISGFRVCVVHQDNWNEFTSFEAYALVDVENGCRSLLQDVVFFLSDLDEVLE